MTKKKVETEKNKEKTKNNLVEKPSVKDSKEQVTKHIKTKNTNMFSKALKFLGF